MVIGQPNCLIAMHIEHSLVLILLLYAVENKYDMQCVKSSRMRMQRSLKC